MLIKLAKQVVLGVNWIDGMKVGGEYGNEWLQLDFFIFRVTLYKNFYPELPLVEI